MIVTTVSEHTKQGRVSKFCGEALQERPSKGGDILITLSFMKVVGKEKRLLGGY